MINVATAVMLSQYKGWADQLFFDSLRELPAQELSRERAGPIKTMIGVLNHIYVIDRIWQAHLQHRDHGFTSRQALPYPDLAELCQAQREVDDWYVAWSSQQSESSLKEVLDFVFVSGNPGSMPAGSMLLHVVNHATYHRGWLVQMYFEIPAMPPLTDLSVYLTECQTWPAGSC
ncbi:DinB family protein [Ectopseudomonas guguanensis]|uniref:DinB family protein n=1 Tax=Ectopseudomonas guguanensis TaxID=1198456 RepID=UPI0028AF645A|nr:DinB family protein [Pseudomonas guguanensis]